MQFLSDLLVFLWAVFNSWAGYATGGSIVALVWFRSTLRQKPVSRKVGIALAVLFLFFAFFHAWREQYAENRIGREVGSLAFDSFGGDLNRHGDMADPQLEINFKNTQPRLLKYEVESVRLEMESKPMEQVFISRGGYVYPNQGGRYRFNYVKDVPIKMIG